MAPRRAAAAGTGAATEALPSAAPTDAEGRAGSGGGGATDIRRGEGRLEDRVLVAGGGAGGGGGGIGGPYGMGGGEGGSPKGHDGFAPLGSANPVTGGRGGTPSVGGTPGANAPDSAVTATGGSLGVGGLGASGGVNGGGGGGGGLYGGGGGGAEFQWTTNPLGAAHGGGGSSFGPSGTSFRNGVWGNLGSGSLTISYDLAGDACAEQDIDRRSGTAYLIDGLHGDVVKTTDGGHMWTQISSLGSGALTVALDPARPNTIYAATDRNHRNRILKSNDGGHTRATAP